MIAAVRLGFRLVRGNDPVLRLRSILTALGSAICALLILCILAAWQVSRIADTRNVAQAPHPDAHGTLLYAEVPDTWHGHDLTRIYVAADGPNAPVPPGLSHLPRSGEVVLSPHLAAELRRHNPELEARFGGLRVAVIGRAGLISASEQLAYVGATPAMLTGAHRVSAFGDSNQVTETTPTLKLTAVLLFIVFVGVPYAGVCAVATRLGAASRRRRLAALWMIGLQPWQLRLASAVESAAAVLAGSIVGIVSYQALRPVIAARVTANGVRPFAADLGLPVLAQVAVLVGVLALAIASGTLLSGSRAWRGTRPHRVTHRFSPAPFAVIGVGVALAVATPVLAALAPRLSHFWRDPLLDATAVTLVVGVTLSLATLLQRGGRLAARAMPSGAGLLAARRLETDPGAMARIGALVLPAVFAVGFAATIATQFHLSDRAARAEAGLGGRQVGTVVPLLDGGSFTTDGIRALVVVPHLEATGPLEVIVASCDQLRALTGQSSLHCPSGRFLLDAEDPAVPALTGQPTLPHTSPDRGPVVVRSLTGSRLTVRYPTQTLRVLLAIPSGTGLHAIVLPPTDPGLQRLGRVAVRQATVAVPAGDAAAVRALRSSVAIHYPLAEVDLAGDSELAANAGYARYGTAVLLLALVASAVGAAGVAIAALDTVLTRQRELQPLLVVGIPRSALRRSTAAEIAIPLSLATALGVAIAIVCGSIFIQRNNGAHLPGLTLTLIGGTGTALAGIVAITAATLVPGTPNRVSARAE